MQFNCETTAFDYTFDSTIGYEIPRAVTGLEWIDEQQIIVTNDKKVKLFRTSKKKQQSTSAVKLLEQSGILSLPKRENKYTNSID